MEKLYAFALLYTEKLVSEEQLRQQLDRLFLEGEHEHLLQWVTERDTKALVLCILARFQQDCVDTAAFGRIFAFYLKEEYRACQALSRFSGLVYRLWRKLPDRLQTTEPYWSLSIADSPLGWGDEAHARRLYEDALAKFD